MKNLFVLIIVLGFTAGINAQVKMPRPPRAPRVADIFEDYNFKLDKKTEEEYLSKIPADLKSKLEEVKKYSEGKYYGLLQQAYFANSDFPFMNSDEDESVKREQKIAALEIDTELLALKYKNAKGANKETLKTNLKKGLGELFDLKEEDRKNEVAELEKELKELRESLEVRKKNKDAIINRRILELLGEDKYLDWD